MKLYVAGPMTGLPEWNYPAFHRAADHLRSVGFEVENPADNALTVPAPKEWADWMRLGLRQVLACDGVALLPGWSYSKGASLEHSVATALGMPTRPVAEWLAASEVTA